MGFEPTPPERLEPKSSALDHSATLPMMMKWFQNLYKKTEIIRWHDANKELLNCHYESFSIQEKSLYVLKNEKLNTSQTTCCSTIYKKMSQGHFDHLIFSI